MKTLPLTLGRHTRKVDWVDLANVKTPEPTDTHKPISHDYLVNELHAALYDAGLQVSQGIHGLSLDEQMYFGLFEVIDFSSPDSTWSTLFGLRNSHNKRAAATVLAGERVWICDNMSFTGEFRISRKHTPNIVRDIPDRMQDVVARVWNDRGRREQEINDWRTLRVAPEVGDHLILEAVRRDIVPLKVVKKVDAEFRNPTHPEHLTAGNRTLWTMYNAITEALKDTSVQALPERTIRLQKLMQDEARMRGIGIAAWQ